MKQLTTTSSKTTTNIKLKHLKSWYSTSLIVSYWCGYLFPFVSFHQWHIAATIKLDNKTFNVLNLFVEKWYTIKRHQKHLETYRFNTWWPVAMVRVVKLTFVFGKRFVVMRSTCSISIFHYYHNTTQLDDVVLFMEFENLLGCCQHHKWHLKFCRILCWFSLFSIVGYAVWLIRYLHATELTRLMICGIIVIGC